MPIYEYQCPHCGVHIEEMQKMSDALLNKCPKCDKPGLQRVMSHTSFQLKGGGYYATDYKKPIAEPKSETKETPPPIDTKKDDGK